MRFATQIAANINWLIATLIYTLGYIRRKANHPSTYVDMGKTGALNTDECGVDSLRLDDRTRDYVSSSATTPSLVIPICGRHDHPPVHLSDQVETQQGLTLSTAY